MKKLFNKVLKIFMDFFRWVWKECRDWRTLVLLAVVCIIIGLPVWGGYLIFFLTHWKWALIMATACLAFWWIPGVPFFALSVSITLAIKKIWEAITKRRRGGQDAASDKADTQAKKGKQYPSPTHDSTENK